MEPKFKFHEIVRIIVQPPGIRKALIGREGLITGMTDPDDQNRRGYAVHLNEYGNAFAIPEDALEATGRFGSAFRTTLLRAVARLGLRDAARFRRRTITCERSWR